ncbi:MAG: hypothetical protein LBU41_02460, partial [Clostridiales Family XIII bacterium]|nr:hypothetical protein [Clostridiales Family XIII bacterium]
MSIRVRVTIIISLIVAIVCAANLGVSLFLTQKHLLETSKADIRVVADVANEYVTTAIDLIKADAMTISQEVDDAPEGDLLKRLETELGYYANFQALAVLTEDDVVAAHGRNPMSEDLLNSPAALRALDGKRGISSTYILMDGHIVFYVCAPMDGNRILAATVDGMYFTKLIEQFQLWDTGYLFILDRDGTILAHVRESWVQTRKNFINEAETNEEYKGLAEVLTHMVQGEQYSGQYVLEGENKLCGTTPIRGSEMGWSLAVVAPINESPLAHTRESLVITAVLFLGACLFIAIIAS